MNCLTHCPLCGRDLFAKLRSECSRRLEHEMFSHAVMAGSRFYIDPTDLPPPIAVDEDRHPTCDCTEETVLARRHK